LASAGLFVLPAFALGCSGDKQGLLGVIGRNG
jgi:hypothetical protein